MAHARLRLVRTKNWRTLIRIVDLEEQSCPEPRNVAKAVKVVKAVTREGGGGTRCGGGGESGGVHYTQTVRVGGGKKNGGSGGGGENVFHEEDDDTEYTEADGGRVRETVAEW